MSKNRKKTNLIHKKGKEIFEVSKSIVDGKLFIKGTNIEVAPNKVTKKNKINNTNYDFSKPHQAQNLGDEWNDYAWSADDY